MRKNDEVIDLPFGMVLERHRVEFDGKARRSRRFDSFKHTCERSAALRE